jgi:hypothetical protein
VIRGVPCDEDEKERRYELGEADETEIERAPRERIHLPADTHRKHLVRNHREHARKPEEDERALRAQLFAGARHRDATAMSRG